MRGDSSKASCNPNTPIGPPQWSIVKLRGEFRMDQSDLLAHLCQQFDRLGIQYLITGSQATIAFGEPRFTNDIDVVARLNLSQVEDFCEAFQAPEYYVSLPAAREAVVSRGMFNVIHPESGLKIDVVISKETAFDMLQLMRTRKITLSSQCSACFISPEDIILKKMEWHRMGGGERHLRDIAGVMRIQGDKLDRDYIAEQAEKLSVLEIWQDLLANEHQP
jgi:hypothetical protein